MLGCYVAVFGQGGREDTGLKKGESPIIRLCLASSSAEQKKHMAGI